MDIPKIYLRKLPANSAYTYDAVDGQQRIRSLWEFRAGGFTLEDPDPLSPIDGFSVDGKSFDDLNQTLRDRFDAFQVSVALITSANNDEITNLFSRLQMGVSLNPAELRNAMHVPMRHVIDTLATSHRFFLDCRIPDARYKRQDYVTHAFAMAAYHGAKDIKAPDLKRMIQEFGPDRTEDVLSITAAVGDAFNVLADVNELLNYRITQKWIFIDLCWLIMQRQAANEVVDPDGLAENFDAFERMRREYTSRPEDLIRNAEKQVRKVRLNRHLYAYIAAFRAQGATHANLKARNVALRAFCN
jgi:hypothetical protein